MKYLVTGATGFVGPHLIRLLLEKQHEVHVIIRGSNGRQMDLLDVLSEEEINRVIWNYGDLREAFTFETIFKHNQFDGVFHLAAQSHPPTSFEYPELTFAINVTGTLNLLHAMKEQPDCRFHFCSTSEVYGNQCTEDGMLSESTPLLPNNPYGTSKAAMDLHIQERIRNSGLNAFITRAFSHTGPRRGYNFSISSDAYQLAKMKHGKQELELLIGNLKTKRVVMDVRDCVGVYYRLMQTKARDVFNVSANQGRVCHMQYYTDELIQISGLNGVQQVVHEPFHRTVDIDVQVADCSKLLDLLGSVPSRPIGNTLTDLFNYWYKKLSV